MKNYNDFGLKKVDFNKRKIKNKNNLIFPFILILISLTIFLYYNNQDLLMVNYDNKLSVEVSSSETLMMNDVVESDSLHNNDTISNKLINHTQIQFEKQIVEIDSVTGNYFIIEGSFSNYNLSLNKANFLNDNGFNAFIISPVNQNKMFRVAVDVYDDIDTAKENLKSYKEKLNNELWILKY